MLEVTVMMVKVAVTLRRKGPAGFAVDLIRRKNAPGIKADG